jgi:hypothetical protein
LSLPLSLETEHLILKKLDREDFDVIWALEFNPEVQGFFNTVETDFKAVKTKFTDVI